MRTLRKPLLLTLLVGGVIGYVAACNNAKPTTDASAAPGENSDKGVASNPLNASPNNEVTDAPSQQQQAQCRNRSQTLPIS